MRLIDADELRLGKFVEPRTEWHKGWNDALDAASTQAPTISPDSLVKRGRWEEIRNTYGELEGWLCECGREVKCKERFCPSCGARMQEN